MFLTFQTMNMLQITVMTAPLVSAYCVPSFSPALIQQIRTVDLVGAGYSAGSWGAKREQSSHHHTEQTGLLGERQQQSRHRYNSTYRGKSRMGTHTELVVRGVLRVGW